MNLNIEVNKLIKKLSVKTPNKATNNVSRFKTKICVYNFFSINESNICDKIKKIPYYFNYYKILIDYDFVELRQLGEKVLEKIKNKDSVTKNDKKLLLFKYDNYVK